ncbi:MAG TPA: glycoside hydrolase family 15 protein [Candidatus Acidoferrum sp.]|nr:glycoside hydrolase family 15 protein [Candidatus Acidoferrum sp.]
MLLEHLGVIGNCQFSAIIERTGEIVWCCLPRFDSEPVFSTLTDAQQGGKFLVGAALGEPGTQSYLYNTNILQTVFETPSGKFQVTDFAPRFEQFGRTFRPTQLYRIVEPLEGAPRIRVACEPKLGWSRAVPMRLNGSNHIRFEGYESRLRLTTDIPISYLNGEPFTLTGRRHLALTWGAPIEEALPPLVERFFNSTRRYWERWVKQCSIPPLYQDAVIRSALALKLHCFEDTGAIVAAMTTSIPEAPGSGRTWDYRYCWLRDAYYCLGAFRLLGQFEERESFIHYLLNVAGSSPGLNLSPLYRIDGTPGPAEEILHDWAGFEGNGPVRVGNGAVRHTQNDVFGEMVLSLVPIFMDDRYSIDRSKVTLKLIEDLARKAVSVAGLPDAGIWEYRTEWKPQTFTGLMCWAAADRMARVAALHAPGIEQEFRSAAKKIQEDILAKAWCPDVESFAGTFGTRDLDASLLQMSHLRFLSLDDTRLRKTIDTIRKDLTKDGWLYRYRLDDGFGVPAVAFVICTFWLVEALADTGRKAEAREIMDRVQASLSNLGLLAEDYESSTRRMWGNFPQAYSHVGLIHAAFAASPEWADAL